MIPHNVHHGALGITYEKYTQAQGEKEQKGVVLFYSFECKRHLTSYNLTCALVYRQGSKRYPKCDINSSRSHFLIFSAYGALGLCQNNSIEYPRNIQELKNYI